MLYHWPPVKSAYDILIITKVGNSESSYIIIKNMRLKRIPPEVSFFPVHRAVVWLASVSCPMKQGKRKKRLLSSRGREM